MPLVDDETNEFTLDELNDMRKVFKDELTEVRKNIIIKINKKMSEIHSEIRQMPLIYDKRDLEFNKDELADILNVFYETDTELTEVRKNMIIKIDKKIREIIQKQKNQIRIATARVQLSLEELNVLVGPLELSVYGCGLHADCNFICCQMYRDLRTLSAKLNICASKDAAKFSHDIERGDRVVTDLYTVHLNDGELMQLRIFIASFFPFEETKDRPVLERVFDKIKYLKCVSFEKPQFYRTAEEEKESKNKLIDEL